ncbi:MAG: glutamate-1-semialdehyde 2,1-aminomutase [Actinomycetota bacterium]
MTPPEGALTAARAGATANVRSEEAFAAARADEPAKATRSEQAFAAARAGATANVRSEEAFAAARADEPARATRSEQAFAAAREVMPGGVSSPVRAFGAVGGTPVFMASGSGARVTDLDGTIYIDLLASWGPLILGHAHPQVLSAIHETAARGTSFGTPTGPEAQLAAAIAGALPSVEMLRLVNSGTEATMSALRLARAATGRSKVLKFAGCYHGHVDSLLVSAGSGVATLGLPDSAGVTAGTSADTLVAPFNDTAALGPLFEAHGSELAAVIVEPVAANMGVVPPLPGFLEALRAACTRAGALLIFDEVITGFRVGWGGAQGLLGIDADLSILGKIVGGGMPIGAYGGSKKLMELVAPVGPVYQAGTLSGNPVGVAAGLATLGQLSQPCFYDRLEELGAALQDGLAEQAKRAGVPATIQRVGSMFTLFFQDRPVTDLATAKLSDTTRFARFFHAMLEEGVYWPPAQFEAAFVSAAHLDSDIEAILSSAGRALERI